MADEEIFGDGQQYEGEEGEYEGEDGEQDIQLTESQMLQLQRQMALEQMMHENGQEYEDGQQYGDGEEYEQGGQEYEESKSQVDRAESARKRAERKKAQQLRDAHHSDDEDEHDEALLRNVKRQLYDNINKERRNRELGKFYQEIMSGGFAQEYADYIINNGHSDSFWNDLLVRSNNSGEVSLCWIVARFEEDVDPSKKVQQDYFREMGYLFFEISEDKEKLLNPEFNSIGIGVSCDDGQIAIVYAISKQTMAINQVLDNGPNTFEIKGQMLQDGIGVFAARVYSPDYTKTKDNTMCIVGADKMDYNKISQEFVITLDVEDWEKGLRKYIEFYTRENADTIPYRKQKKEKINLRHVVFQLRIPYGLYPDPKYMDEELAAERQAEEQARLEQEMLKNLEQNKHQEELKQSQIDVDEDSDDNKEEEQENEEEKELEMKQERNQPTISNREIRQELEAAINEANRQAGEFREQNERLQMRIKEVRRMMGISDEQHQAGDSGMNDHKYLNTLAHVHQIRLDLKQTQDKYNQMSHDLQVKLEEKQKKCNEIKLAFMELKREVAKKAAFSRTDKPIPEAKITEWEEMELEKSKTLQELRLDILRLRNTYIKNQKILKKKEELAEGLHLIDFEQLRIENQTLTEKIEQRNEDLHKLRKQNTNTVQILTHTREKLGYIQNQNSHLLKISIQKEDELKKLRKDLNGLKKSRDELRVENFNKRQEAGIVNSDYLQQDYKQIRDRTGDLVQKQIQLENKLRSMIQIIEAHQKMKQMDNRLY